MALAKGARAAGARIFEQTARHRGHDPAAESPASRPTPVDIEAEVVVNCTGMWGREFGQDHGVALPLQALAHYYVVTENIPGLGVNLPTIKSSDDFAYVKDEAGALMVGFFEPGSYAWSSRGIPAETEFATPARGLGPPRPVLRADDRARPGPRRDRHSAVLQRTGKLHAGRLLPPRRGSRRSTTTTPPADSTRSGSSPGRAPVRRSPSGSSTVTRHVDIPEADPRRVIPFQTNRRYLEQRVVETLDKAYTIHWPFEQRESARGIRRSPLHDRVGSAGAVFGELAGWERANWYAANGVAADGRADVRASALLRRLGGGAPRGPRGRGSLRHQLLRQAARPGPGLLGAAAEAVVRRRRRRARAGRLHPVAQRSRRYRSRRHGDAHRGDRVPRPHCRSDRRSRREPAAPAHRRHLRHCHGRERWTRDAVRDGASLAGPARALDGRGPLQRRVPVPFVTAHRPRADVRQSHPDHLRRRARLGAARPLGCRRTRLRHADGVRAALST